MVLQHPLNGPISWKFSFWKSEVNRLVFQYVFDPVSESINAY